MKKPIERVAISHPNFTTLYMHPNGAQIAHITGFCGHSSISGRSIDLIASSE
jgi:hypothetical protein